MKIIKDVRPPTGLPRLFYRLPILVYRLGLGWMLGSNLLLLNHVGRRTGKIRRSVLEVVEHDRADDSYVVAAGWGTSSAWYRNVLHTPDVTIQLGGNKRAVTALPLSKDEGKEIFTRYAARHPKVARWLLPHVLGLSVDGSQADFQAVGRQLPFVRFVPRT